MISEFVDLNLGASLKDVLPASLAALGANAVNQGELQIPDARHVVVILIDGLGTHQLNRHPLAAPLLSSRNSHSISTEFPSTTPVALGSLGTALPPGSHGFVGASFWLPDHEEMLAPLKWGSIPNPLSMSPEPTAFEVAASQGIDVVTIADGKHQDSGLTRSVMRGSQYLPARTQSQILLTFADRQKKLLGSQAPALTYIYWPELDRVGHVHGPESTEWIAELSKVGSLVEGIVSLLGPDDVTVVTSDHGMICCPLELRMHIESNMLLMQGIVRIGGEPRVRHIYTNASATPDVYETWRTVLKEKAMVFTREEVVDNGIYAVTEDEIAGRIGDLVVISQGEYALSSDPDLNSSKLLGQHGSLTREEMIIPFLVFPGGANSSLESWDH